MDSTTVNAVGSEWASGKPPVLYCVHAVMLCLLTIILKWKIIDVAVIKKMSKMEERECILGENEKESPSKGKESKEDFSHNEGGDTGR